MQTVTPSPADGTFTRKAPGVQRTILAALQTRGRHIYGGTVPEAEVDRRRAVNKRARAARRVNRRRSA